MTRRTRPALVPDLAAPLASFLRQDEARELQRILAAACLRARQARRAAIADPEAATRAHAAAMSLDGLLEVVDGIVAKPPMAWGGPVFRANDLGDVTSDGGDRPDDPFRQFM